MNISEMIKRLETLREEKGDAELLFCGEGSIVFYTFETEDWSDPESCPNQILIKGCEA